MHACTCTVLTPSGRGIDQGSVRPHQCRRGRARMRQQRRREASSALLPACREGSVVRAVAVHRFHMLCVETPPVSSLWIIERIKKRCCIVKPSVVKRSLRRAGHDLADGYPGLSILRFPVCRRVSYYEVQRQHSVFLPLVTTRI